MTQLGGILPVCCRRGMFRKLTFGSGASRRPAVLCDPVPEHSNGSVPCPARAGFLLDDGTSRSGFIIELWRVEGMEEIAHHGGWRAYVAFKGISRKNRLSNACLTSQQGDLVSRNSTSCETKRANATLAFNNSRQYDRPCWRSR